MTYKIIISKGSTYFWFRCPEHGIICNGVSISDFLEKHLTEHKFNFRFKYWQIDKRYARYDKEKKRMYLPINYLPLFLNTLYEKNVKEHEIRIIEKKINPGKKINIEMQSMYKDRNQNQTDAVDFLCQDKYMKALSLQTGCLHRDSWIDYKVGNKKITSTIEELSIRKLAYRKYKLVTKSLGRWFERNNTINFVEETGEQELWRIVLVNGLWLDMTNDHRVAVKTGWFKYKFLPLSQIKPGDKVRHKRKGLHRYSEVLLIRPLNKDLTYDIGMQAPYNSFYANDILVHNSGKTYCAIKTIAKIKQRAMIIVSGLIEQWEEEILNMTNLTLDEVYTIKGYDSLVKLKKMYDSDAELPKILLVSTGTIRNYVARKKKPYKRLPKAEKFFKQLGIGLKIIDEVHLNFAANVQIDLNLSVYHNVYLSATYQRTSKEGNRIFRTVFPSNMIYGGANYKRYVNITAYKYNLIMKHPDKFMTNQGYNQFRYETQLMKDKDSLAKYLNYTVGIPIREKFHKIRKPNQKALIIASSVKMCETIKEYLDKEFAYKTQVYVYETEDDVLDASDIIISTIGSAGTGRDIRNLRTVILNSSFSAENPLIQVLGRARELKDDTPEFVYSYNASVTAQVRHFQNRLLLYSRLGKTHHEITLY